MTYAHSSIFWCNDCYRVMIGRPPSFRAEVREIDLIACEMTYIESFMHNDICPYMHYLLKRNYVYNDWNHEQVSVRCVSLVTYLRGGPPSVVRCEAGSMPAVSERMHRMDARALRGKDASKGERPWGDTVRDPWISDRETVSKPRG